MEKWDGDVRGGECFWTPTDPSHHRTVVGRVDPLFNIIFSNMCIVPDLGGAQVGQSLPQKPDRPPIRFDFINPRVRERIL